jgi:hypothetical protein
MRTEVAVQQPSRHLQGMAKQKLPTRKGMSVKWGDIQDLPILVVDQMHWRVFGGRCFLTFGQLNIPMSDGPLPDGSVLDVRPLVRMEVPANVLAFWIESLKTASDNLKPKNGEAKK